MNDYDVKQTIEDWLNPNLGKPWFEIPVCIDGIKTQEEFLATTAAIRHWSTENKFSFSFSRPDSFVFEGKEVPNRNLHTVLMKFEKHPGISDGRLDVTNEFDRLHGRIHNWHTRKFDRPFKLRVAYWFRRLFRSRALLDSETPQSRP